MQTIGQPITGAESPTDCAAYNSLLAFYRAFNQRDLALMADNWSQSEQASMSNPLGDVRRGWEAIRAVYTRIFTGPAQVYVEFYDYSLHLSGDMFCAVGRERGHVQMADQRIELAIRTSRIYRLEARQWRQLHHHGSIDKPELLARYQEAVHKLK